MNEGITPAQRAELSLSIPRDSSGIHCSDELLISLGEHAQPLGHLRLHNKLGTNCSSFRFDPTWLRHSRRFMVSPDLQAVNATQWCRQSGDGGAQVFAALHDTIPSGFGKQLVQRAWVRGLLGEMGACDDHDAASVALCAVPDHARLGALRVRAQAGVERQVARRGGHAIFQVRAVGDEVAARRQVAGGALHQPRAAGPGRDVQHVGAVDQVERRGAERRAFAGPAVMQHVQSLWRPHVAGTCLLGPGGDRCEVGVVQVCGLPGPAGQGGCKVRGVLAGAAGNLQRGAGRWQQGQQLRQDGALVAFGGGAVLEGGGGH